MNCKSLNFFEREIEQEQLNSFDSQSDFIYFLQKYMDSYFCDFKGIVNIETENEGYHLNLNFDEHKSILLSEIKKSKKIWITNLSELDMLENKENWYKGEYVLSRYDEVKTYLKEKVTYSCPEAIESEKVFYFKFYMQKKFELHFLLNFLFPTAKNAIKNNLIDGFHFVRYIENGDHHIRVRFFKEKSSDLTQKNISLIVKKLEDYEFISGIEKCRFWREEYRYGGVHYPLYENISQLESFLILQLLSSKRINTDKKSLYYLLSLDILEASSHVNEFQYRYKPYRKEYRNTCESFHKKKCIIRQRVCMLEEELNNLNSYKTWKSEVEKYYSLVSAPDITFSMLHMLNNRLFGIERHIENELMAELSILLDYIKFVG
ncbi:thiopeptide-type bacteriocin biosynthesis protein [Aerococcaceae bacterium zg-ZJ1578]|uniref:thiopeptide-type bacteriocin biosynthesis protein n=1 Tax=Aerococcaceae bacterium zg-252 TaxID=2796928 RepID=UPI001A2D61DB|nr:thiopeptide-type bacteriocin biosynthesis protein [Aerococcaceae bacterium zg-1578]